jgi:hypothetical protein
VPRLSPWGVKATDTYSWQPYSFRVPIVFKYGSLNLLESSRSVQGLPYLAILWAMLPLLSKAGKAVTTVLIFWGYAIQMNFRK